MSKSYKCVQRAPKTLEDLVADGVQELVDLGEECQESSDNFPNSDHPKAQAFAEAADTLTGLEAPDLNGLPDEIAQDLLSWNESVPKDKRRQASRDVRRTNAIGQLEIARDRLNEWADEKEAALEEGRTNDEANKEEVESLSEGARRLVEDAREKVEEDVQAARDAAQALDDVIGEAEGVEFPGLYG